MPDAHLWLLFCLAVFGLASTPGPNMLHALTTSAHAGFKQSLASSVGCIMSSLLMTSLSMLGVGAFIQAEPRCFDVIKYIGGAYLIFLGLSTLRHWRRQGVSHRALAGVARQNTAANLRRGFFVGVSNPKLILFAIAFFPPFIDLKRAVLPQFAMLYVTFAIIEAFWLLAYGLGGARLGAALLRPRVGVAFNIVSGLIFILFGAAVISAKL